MEFHLNKTAFKTSLYCGNGDFLLYGKARDKSVMNLKTDIIIVRRLFKCYSGTARAKGSTVEVGDFVL